MAVTCNLLEIDKNNQLFETIMRAAVPERGDSLVLNRTSLFPESPRVIYKNNPLIQVICQVRFPAILRIETEPPADFQDRIRDTYPILVEKAAADEALELPPNIPSTIRTLLMAGFRQRTNKSYDFKTADEKWTVGLTRDFVALTTTNYERWEKFSEQVEHILEAIVSIYRPTFFTRVGLRYRNLIQPEKLGLERRLWAELLESRIAGLLDDSKVGRHIEGQSIEVVFSVPESKLKIGFRHGVVIEEESKKEGYLIDSDFYWDETTPTGLALEILGNFNKESARLFRWCIKSELHDAMGPEPI